MPAAAWLPGRRGSAIRLPRCLAAGRGRGCGACARAAAGSPGAAGAPRLARAISLHARRRRATTRPSSSPPPRAGSRYPPGEVAVELVCRAVPGGALSQGLGTPGRGVLDQGEHPAGHEPGRPHHHAAAGHLVDLHQPAPGDHLDPAASPGCHDLVGLSAAATRVDDDLDPVTLHRGRPDARRLMLRPMRHISVFCPNCTPRKPRFHTGWSMRKVRPHRPPRPHHRNPGRSLLLSHTLAALQPCCATTLLRYNKVRADQRELRCSMASGTPKHLDRFSSVNTRSSRPAASTEPRRMSIAWVNPAGTSSTWWVTITR